MLMRGMLRRVPLFVLALTLWFAAEPSVHSHPLLSGGGSPSVCAVCATGIDRPVAAPSIAAPLHVIAILQDAPSTAVTSVAVILVTSRAPPAA
jgi:hypothetical protein